MAQMTLCLCDGKDIGIETIFTVVNGMQINIPEKIKWLRKKSQNNELFCACGCGANVILVAGDKNIREQHFRMKHGTYEDKGHIVTETKSFGDSMIVLKCWLEEKLSTSDVETRVPINLVGDTERKYEFSLLSRSKKLAVSYCRDRANLSDEKLEILKSNSNAIRLIYVSDIMNSGNNGQYPEALMKVQDRQGYCLFLNAEDRLYNKATMCAVFYIQDINGLWKEVRISEGHLSDYTVSEEGKILYKNEVLSILVDNRITALKKAMQEEKERREKEIKRREEEQKRIQEEAKIRQLEFQKEQEKYKKEREQQEEIRKRKENEKIERQAERRRRDEEFKRNIEADLEQQKTPVIDAEGKRWIKCEFCGVIAKEAEFSSYGGYNHVNLGTCRECSAKGADKKVLAISKSEEAKTKRDRYDASICPECGGKLKKKNGPYGAFVGCSNYPRCVYRNKIRRGFEF